MKALQSRPPGYQMIYMLDCEKNMKAAGVIGAISIIFSLAMILPIFLFVPLSSFFSWFKTFMENPIRIPVVIASAFAYMGLHEFIHGAVMKACGTKKVKYGFRGQYFQASSEDYYDKQGYIIIALAPIAVFALVYTILCVLVPREWFWAVYFLQVINITSAAKDCFVLFKLRKMPKDVLIKDYREEKITALGRRAMGGGDINLTVYAIK